MLPKQLSKIDKNTKIESISIDDIMASYSLILGFDFDYNTVPYTKYFVLQNQVNTKFNSIKTKNTMANKNEVITRKDIIEDEALQFGDKYKEQAEIAIDATKKLIETAK